MQKGDILAGQFLGEVERAAANKKTHFVLELTALSLLLDRGLATLPEIEQRIQQVRGRLPGDWQADAVTEQLAAVIDVLRDVYGPKSRPWTPKVIEGGPAND